MSVGNKEEKFIAINRATKQTKQYCDMLLEMYREISEVNVKFEPNVAFSDVFQSLGTVSVESYTVTGVFTDTTPIYTGEVKVKDVGDTVVQTFDILQDGRKLVLLKNGRIQLYDEKNTFITKIIIPVKEKEQCFSLLIDNSTEDAMVSTSRGRFFKVIIGDKLAGRELNTNKKITILTKYDDSVLRIVYDHPQRQFQLCVIDKNMENIIKTILNDDWTMFSAPLHIGVSADKNTIYVLDNNKGCYGITLDGQIVFHYQNPEANHYSGLVVASEGLFIQSFFAGHEFNQVEKINFSGEREEVFKIFDNSYPQNWWRTNLFCLRLMTKLSGFIAS